MHDTNIFSSVFYSDAALTTAGVLLNIKGLEALGVLRKPQDISSLKCLLYGFVGATTLKTWNEYFRTEKTNDIAKFADFAVDTIVILPLVVNIWQPDNKILSYGSYLGVVLGFLPQYLAKISYDSAKYIIHLYSSNEDFDYDTNYTYATFRGVIPAFVRGITFFKLKQHTNSEPISALIAGSVMGMMLDNSDTYTAMVVNMAISALNAGANKISYLKFNSFLDNIYPDSSTMIAIEFAEYFLRTAKIEHLLNSTYEDNKHIQTNALIPIINNNNDNMNNEL